MSIGRGWRKFTLLFVFFGLTATRFTQAQEEPSSTKGQEGEAQDKTSESAARDYLRLMERNRDRARQALKLVEAERWSEAAALLEKLSDVDFLVPRRHEIVSVRGDGAFLTEVIPEHAIGDRRAALVRCYYHLGRLTDARLLVWRVIGQDRFEPTCFRCIVELNREDLDAVVRRTKSISESNVDNRTARRLTDYVKLVRLLNAHQFDKAVSTILSGCSCPPDQSPLSPKDAYDRLAAETIADRGAEVVGPLIAALQPSPEEVHPCIVHALSRSGDRRALRALESARKNVRNYHVRLRLDEAIALLRRRLEDSKPESQTP
ncbi:MAG: hypothetical protein RIC55_01235 [Pirellulaceae bacterium]